MKYDGNDQTKFHVIPMTNISHKTSIKNRSFIDSDVEKNQQMVFSGCNQKYEFCLPPWATKINRHF